MLFIVWFEVNVDNHVTLYTGIKRDKIAEIENSKICRNKSGLSVWYFKWVNYKC